MLIGLHGKARSGKDTIYQMIAEEFGDTGTKVVRDAFADRLKLSAARNFYPTLNVADAFQFGEFLKDGGRIQVVAPEGDVVSDISGRQFLQRYGTEAHRSVFGNDFWIDAVLPDWRDDDYGRKDGLTRNDILVITDVRFVNEAEHILDCGGSIWHIIRDEVETGDSHASEQVLPPEYINYSVENNSTLDSLRAKVHFGVWNEISQQVAHG